MVTSEEFFKFILLFIVLIIVLNFTSKTIINALKQDKYKRQSIKDIEKIINHRIEKTNKKGGVKK